MSGASAILKSTGLSASATTWTRCCFWFGLGTGAESLIFMLFSMPPLAEEYCQAFIVVGVPLEDIGIRKILAVILDVILS